MTKRGRDVSFIFLFFCLQVIITGTKVFKLPEELQLKIVVDPLGINLWLTVFHFGIKCDKISQKCLSQALS